jgi:hypothetical protein
MKIDNMHYNTTSLQNALRSAYLRNPDAYQIIGAVSGLGKKRVKDIADGKVKPSFMEQTTLETLA